MSALWTADDVPAVVRLIRLRARIDAEGVASCPVSLFGQVASLEDRLVLTPRARRREGINLVPAAGAEGNGGPRASVTQIVTQTRLDPAPRERT